MSRLPLAGVKVVEFAGLAPGPFAAMVLADFGASVIRIDRVDNEGRFGPVDVLNRGKRSIAVNPKTPAGHRVIKKLVDGADVLIDPFRLGTLDRLGFGAAVFLGDDGSNRRLVYARLLGFPPNGPLEKMAGHDLNYISQSGVLSLLPPTTPDGKPSFPNNILADFAGGGLNCAMGILLALFERERSGLGQVVETNMVDGTRYVSMFQLMQDCHPSKPNFGKPGENILDGGAPFYDLYSCKDGGWMAVACLEPHFFTVFAKLLVDRLPRSWRSARAPGFELDPATQIDRNQWPLMRKYLQDAFLTRSRDDWAAIFHGTDACATPVLSSGEAAASKGNGRVPAAHPVLHRTPALPPSDAIIGRDLKAGMHTRDILLELGLSEMEIETLAKERIIDAHNIPRSKL